MRTPISLAAPSTSPPSPGSRLQSKTIPGSVIPEGNRPVIQFLCSQSPSGFSKSYKSCVCNRSNLAETVSTLKSHSGGKRNLSEYPFLIFRILSLRRGSLHPASLLRNFLHRYHRPAQPHGPNIHISRASVSMLPKTENIAHLVTRAARASALLAIHIDVIHLWTRIYDQPIIMPLCCIQQDRSDFHLILQKSTAFFSSP